MRLLFINLLLTVFVTAQDTKVKVLSQVLFPQNLSMEAVSLMSGRDLLFTREVKINGHTAGVFVIDTGANVSMIEKSVAEKLGLSQNLNVLDGINDRKKKRFLQVDSFQIGNIEIKNHLIYTGSFSQSYFKFKEKVIGVLGGDILGMMPYTIDNKNLILKFYKRDSFKPQGQEFPLEIHNKMKNLGGYSKANPYSGTPVVIAKVNDSIKLPLLIDTAEESALILRSQEAQSNRNLAGAYKIPGIFRKSGGSTEQYNALVEKLTIFDTQLKVKNKSYILFPRSGTPVLNSQVGGRILSQFNMSFDYKNKKMWAEKFSGKRIIRGESDFAGHTEIARQVRLGNLANVKDLLKKGAPRKFIGLRRETLLMLAMESDSPQVLEKLLKIGDLDINMPSSLGVTPIMRAAAANQVMMLNTLIDYKAHVNRTDNDGLASLHYAVLGGSRVTCAILIDNKANLDAETKAGFRPLSLAAGQGNLGLYMSLVEAGAQVAFIDSFGRSVLHLAAFGNNPKLITAVLSHKSAPSIDLPNKQGYTPLMIAVERQRIVAAQTLLNLGASVKVMNPKDFTTVLDMAYKTKNSKLIKMIEKAWASSPK